MKGIDNLQDIDLVNTKTSTLIVLLVGLTERIGNYKIKGKDPDRRDVELALKIENEIDRRIPIPVNLGDRKPFYGTDNPIQDLPDLPEGFSIQRVAKGDSETRGDS